MSALIALIVATSGGATVSPASAAGIRTAELDTVQARQDECTNFHEDPCVYLIRMTPTEITIGLEPGMGALVEYALIPGSYSEYHVRWSARGGPEKPETVGPESTGRTQTFTITKKADDVATFRFAVQRCKKVSIGKDDCTGWTVRTYGGTETGIEISPNPNAAGNGIETKPNPRTKQDNGIETTPNPNAAGNGIETKPNPRTKQDNGIETKPKSHTRQ